MLATTLWRHRLSLGKSEYIRLPVSSLDDTHSIRWTEAEVVEREQYLSIRKIKEALIIRTTSHNMNTDAGVHVHPVWF